MKEVPEIKRNIKATWINGSVQMMMWISICQYKFYNSKQTDCKLYQLLKNIYLRVATVHQQFCLDLPVWKGHYNSMKPIITVGG